jgi:hypothetical protein
VDTVKFEGTVIEFDEYLELMRELLKINPELKIKELED